MIIRLLVIAAVLLISDLAEAKKPTGLHAYVSVGQNFTFPGSIRIGWNEWEAGQIAPAFYGLGKQFYFSEEFYTEFGFALVGVVHTVGVGFFAAIGANYPIWIGFSIRGEVQGYVEHNSQLGATGSLGVAYDF
jgi:hypothetical protein